MADHEMDLRGLTCPIPVMRTAKKMLTLKVGQTLHVLATDPLHYSRFRCLRQGLG